MKAEYKGTKFDGTPEEVTKAIAMMQKNEPTVMITYVPTELWNKFPYVVDATTTNATGVVTYYYSDSDTTPGVGG